MKYIFILEYLFFIDCSLLSQTTDRGTTRRFTLVPVLHLEEDETSYGDVALDDFLTHSQLSLQSSCSSSMGGDRSGERPVSAENLLPEPSIASITTSTEASRLSTVSTACDL